MIYCGVGELVCLVTVSKDVKYADKMPLIPWGPRFTKSSQKDMQINLAISAVFTAWILIKRNAAYKPLQFLAFAFVYRLFEKLKATEPAVSPTLTEDGEDDGKGLRMGKRLLRSLALSFGCIAFASLAYTCILNVVEYTSGFIPIVLYNNQEPIITAVSAVSLYILASYYR
ncbi:Protein CHLOROPLAST J-LIKE DOMAIN 1, chloroplastic [Linum perenne]